MRPRDVLGGRPGDGPTSFFLAGLWAGGTEVAVLRLVEHLHEQGHDVELVVAVSDGELLARARRAVPLVELGARRTATALPALRTHLRRRRPRAVVSALEHANILSTLACSGLGAGRPALVLTVHSMLGHRSLERRRRSSLALRALMPALYPRADAVVAVSAALRSELARHVPRAVDRLHDIPNPVASRAEQAADGTPLHPWLDQGVPVVLAVGRLVVEKDYPTLLRAFAVVVQDRPARLLVLGEGEQRSTLLELVQALGLTDVVDLAGQSTQVFQHMCGADVLALSSVSEGFGNVVVEALQAGLAVVSTDCGGPREILADGEFGTLVPVGDVDALALGIARALDRDRHEAPALQARAREYDVSRIAQRYLALVDEVATTRARR